MFPIVAQKKTYLPAIYAYNTWGALNRYKL